MPKARIEEDKLSPVVEKFLARKYSHTKREVLLSLPEWKGAGRSIRLDVVASDGKELVLVETKAACYPQIIGDAIGQLLVYEQIIFQNKERFVKVLSDKGITVQAIGKLKLYSAFPNHKHPENWMEWVAPATEVFRAVAGERQIGLLLIQFKKDASAREWEEIGKDNLDDLEVVEV